MSIDITNTPPPGQIPPSGDPPGQMPPTQPTTPPPGQMSGDPQNQQQVPIESLPQVVQDYIRSLRKEAETNRKKLEAEAKAKQEAEQARLKEQGQFKELAEKHEARVKELEPIATRYTSLSALVASQIDTQIKDWPAEVKTFDPGKDAPIEERLAWVEKSRPLIEKLTVQARGTIPGNSPSPRPISQETGRDAQIEELRRRDRGMYKVF